MRIAIFGSGGVGGYFGGRLAASGSDVTFIARGAHLAAMRKDGIRIASPLGDLHLPQVRLAETIAEAGPVDLVLVGVKLWDTEQVAANLAPAAAQGTAILSLQNGVQKDDILRRHMPADAVMGGVCYIAATIASPGLISHAGTMQRLVFGEYGKATSARTQEFLAACLKAGIAAELSPSIERLIWEKFVFLVGLSGTTTRYGTPIGPIRTDPQKRDILLRAMQEVVAVGQAKGVPLPAGFAEDRLGFCDTIPDTMTSSMQVDLERGNRLELPWLSGAVVSLGKEFGVETPVNAEICSVLEPYVMGRR